jgi:hypothetical protein
MSVGTTVQAAPAAAAARSTAGARTQAGRPPPPFSPTQTPAIAPA